MRADAREISFDSLASSYLMAWYSVTIEPLQFTLHSSSAFSWPGRDESFSSVERDMDFAVRLLIPCLDGERNALRLCRIFFRLQSCSVIVIVMPPAERYGFLVEIDLLDLP